MKTPFRASALLMLSALVPACGENDEVTIIQAAPTAVPGQVGSGSSGSYGAGVEPGVVFIMDRNTDGIQELWSADLDGTVLMNLSGPMIPGGAVRDFYWSPDRTLVAFSADKDVLGRPEVYVVAATGGTPLRVVTLGFGGSCILSDWSPDSSRFHYTLFTGGGSQQRAVRADGTGDVVLFQVGIGEPYTMSAKAWSPDSRHFAVILRKTAQPVVLRVIDSDDGSFVDVSGPVTPGNLTSYAWAPDGSRLAFVGDRDTPGLTELFSVLPDSAASVVKLSGTIVANGDVGDLVGWSPDSTRIAFTGDLQTDTVMELFTAPAATADAVAKVSGTIPGGETLSGPIAWAPDGSRLLYGTADGTFRITLHSTLPASAAAVQISPVPLPGGDGVKWVSWSPDATRVAYIADHSTAGTEEIYTAPAAAAGSAVKVSLASPPLGAIASRLSWAPDGSRVAYLASHQPPGYLRAYVAPAATLNGAALLPTTDTGDLWDIRWSGSSRVICPNNRSVTFSELHELFSFSIPGGTAVLVSGPALESAFIDGPLDWTAR